MRTTVTIDDELGGTAVEVADPGMDKAEIVLELACGTPPAPRERTLIDLEMLRQAQVATTEELLSFIEAERL
jgi:hypothetical protein